MSAFEEKTWLLLPQILPWTLLSSRLWVSESLLDLTSNNNSLKRKTTCKNHPKSTSTYILITMVMKRVSATNFRPPFINNKQKAFSYFLVVNHQMQSVKLSSKSCKYSDYNHTWTTIQFHPQWNMTGPRCWPKSDIVSLDWRV